MQMLTVSNFNTTNFTFIFNVVYAGDGELDEDELGKLLQTLWKEEKGTKMPGDIKIRSVEDIRKGVLDTNE